MSLRSEEEAELYAILDVLDPSGKNTERMRNFLKSMDDKAFHHFMDRYYENDSMLPPVAYAPYDNPVSLDFCHRAAKKLNVPIYEIVYRPYLNGDTEDPPGTVHEIMVLDVLVKRLKQMAYTKNHSSVSASRRDAKTGQVTGEDRTARVTDVEAYSLLSSGQYSAAQEFYGPMADDMEAHYAMLRAIQRDGEVELRDLPNDPTSKVTLNTINTFMLGSCLATNFISADGYVLPITMKGQDEHISTIKR